MKNIAVFALGVLLGAQYSEKIKTWTEKGLKKLARFMLLLLFFGLQVKDMIALKIKTVPNIASSGTCNPYKKTN